VIRWDYFTKEGVIPVGPEMEIILTCMDKLLGRNLGISGGAECQPPHAISETRGHCAGKAADISKRMNPNLDPEKVMCVAKKCGAQYGLIESTHYHVQTHTSRSGRSGDLPKCDCIY